SGTDIFGSAIIEGSANDATIFGGGAATVSSGGVASGMTVSFGGNEYVSGGGLDSGGTAKFGGQVWVGAGGTARDGFISGGALHVSGRSAETTSEVQSRSTIVCRLVFESAGRADSNGNGG